jgi:hypothetical protein
VRHYGGPGNYAKLVSLVSSSAGSRDCDCGDVVRTFVALLVPTDCGDVTLTCFATTLELYGIAWRELRPSQCELGPAEYELRPS